MSGIVDAVRGEGRTGRVGFGSKDLIRDKESGMGAPLALNGELGPPRTRRIVVGCMYVSKIDLCPRRFSCVQFVVYGLLAVVRSGVPGVGPGLRVS
jgi:hypothetical protein